MRKGLVRTADRVLILVRRVGDVAAWSALALVLLVAGNVLFRYFLGMSSVASQELEWHVMAFTALIGMAYGINRGGEVRVDVLFEYFPPRVQAAVDIFSAAALFLVSLALFYFSIGYVTQSYRMGEGSPDPGGLDHRFLLKALIPVAFFYLCVQCFGALLANVGKLAGEETGERGAP